MAVAPDVAGGGASISPVAVSPEIAVAPDVSPRRVAAGDVSPEVAASRMSPGGGGGSCISRRRVAAAPDVSSEIEASLPQGSAALSHRADRARHARRLGRAWCSRCRVAAATTGQGRRAEPNRRAWRLAVAAQVGGNVRMSASQPQPLGASQGAVHCMAEQDLAQAVAADGSRHLLRFARQYFDYCALFARRRSGAGVGRRRAGSCRAEKGPRCRCGATRAVSSVGAPVADRPSRSGARRRWRACPPVARRPRRERCGGCGAPCRADARGGSALRR